MKGTFTNLLDRKSSIVKDAECRVENLKNLSGYLPEEEYRVRNAISNYQCILDRSENDKDLSINIKKIIIRAAKSGYFSLFLHYILDLPLYQQRVVIIRKLKVAKVFLNLISVKPIEKLTLEV